MSDAERVRRVDAPAHAPALRSPPSRARRRTVFACASLALALALVLLTADGVLHAFLAAALVNLAVVTWSSFVLPLRGLPRLEGFYRLRRWERSGRLYRWLGVPLFRAAVRRGPLARFNRALPAAWRSGDVEWIERETRAAEAGHSVAFAIVLALAGVAFLRGEAARAAWLAILDLPMNLYPVLLQRDHRIRLAALRRRAERLPDAAGRWSDERGETEAAPGARD